MLLTHGCSWRPVPPRQLRGSCCHKCLGPCWIGCCQLCSMKLPTWQALAQGRGPDQYTAAYTDLPTNETIAEGTFGSIKLAKRRVDGEPAAVKVLPVRHPVDVSREVEVMRLLQTVGGHPNIVSLRGVFHDGKHSVLIVMELCDSSLDDWLWRRGGQVGFAAHTLCRDMWEGIAFLHSAQIRILRRDIKPANMLLTHVAQQEPLRPGLLLKISDFGSSMRLGMLAPGSGLSPRRASLYWAAPEVLRGSMLYGFPSDVWGVGCVAAELLCGRQLFKGKDWLQARHFNMLA